MTTTDPTIARLFPADVTPANATHVIGEFCEMVGAQHLLSYLDLPVDCTAAQAQLALTVRRKRLQSMQSNPKYKVEARFIIKHYHLLQEVLAAPADHLQEMNLHVLGTAIQGVLRAGSITRNQRARLAKDAYALGVPYAKFNALLGELAAEAGIGVDGAIDWDETAAGAAPRGMLSVPIEPALLEIVGDAERIVDDPSTTTIELMVGNAGAPPMTASVSTTVPWLIVDADRLHPTMLRQTIEVRLDRSLLPGRRAVGAVTIETDAGQMAEVRYVVQPSKKWIHASVAASLLLVFGMVGVVGAWGFLASEARGSTPGLIVQVDPGADSVQLAGEPIGSGRTIRVHLQWAASSWSSPSMASRRSSSSWTSPPTAHRRCPSTCNLLGRLASGPDLAASAVPSTSPARSSPSNLFATR